MKNSDIVIGLDIGTTKVRAIAARKDHNGTIEILGVGIAPSTGLSRGVIVNIDNTVQAIKAAVGQLQDAIALDITEVYAGIAGKHITTTRQESSIVRENESEEITKEDIQRLNAIAHKVNLPHGYEIIQVVPQEYTIDGEVGIKEPIGMAGLRISAEYLLILADIASTKNIFRSIERAGLKLKWLFLEPIAAAEAVLDALEKRGGVALIDIGGGTSDVIIVQDGIVRETLIIPFGGKIITEDIRKGCKIVVEWAEELKVNYGSAIPEEKHHNQIITIPGIRHRTPRELSRYQLSEIIYWRIVEIMKYIMAYIDGSKYHSEITLGIVLSGGGAKLKNIDKVFELGTGFEVRTGTASEYLNEKYKKQFDDPEYATGIGLCILGIQHEAKNPKEDERKKEEKQEVHTISEVADFQDATHELSDNGMGNNILSFFKRIFGKSEGDMDEFE
ncbi:MAG: cell division protein FtsA [Chitinophagales bacterium]